MNKKTVTVTRYFFLNLCDRLSVAMCACALVYICTHMCMHACMRIIVVLPPDRLSLAMCVCVCVCSMSLVYVCTHCHPSMCMHACMRGRIGSAWLCVCVCSRVCLYTYVYAHIYAVTVLHIGYGKRKFSESICLQANLRGQMMKRP
jgi:hypothetical protein